MNCTTVTLCLPAADIACRGTATAPKDTEDARTDAVAEAMTSARVLVVNDEDLLREVLAERLEAAGYGVLAAANGNEALVLFAAGEAVDVLVTDLSMPDMNGIAVIRAAQAACPGLPAVLLTGYAGEDATLSAGGTPPPPAKMLAGATALTSHLGSFSLAGKDYVQST